MPLSSFALILNEREALLRANFTVGLGTVMTEPPTVTRTSPVGTTVLPPVASMTPMAESLNLPSLSCATLVLSS